MKLSLSGLCISALVFTACDSLPTNQSTMGPEVITAVAQRVEAGHPDQAKTLLDRRRLPKIEYFDPSDPQYCTEAGVTTRLNDMAVDIASDILDLESADPVTRYAIFKKELESNLETQDGIFFGAGYCNTSFAALALAYNRTRLSIVAAAQGVLDRYEQAARSHTIGDFDAAVDRAVQDYARTRRKAQEDTCRKHRSKLEEADATLDPMIAQALQTSVSHCRLMGL